MIDSINIGSITINLYSLCILFGVIIAYIVIMKEAKRKQIDNDIMFNIIFYGILAGIIGARLYYVIFNFEYYRYHLDEIIKIWHGGLAIHGGIIGGFIVVYLYSKKKNISLLKLTDTILPGVLIAQAFGRWGNFFNQEAYGISVSKELLHNLLVPNFIIEGMHINGLYYLPTFYFESIFCILGFILILILRRKIKFNGFSTAFYLIWYGSLRFVIEYFRNDSLMLFNIKVAMIVSAIMILIGIIIIIRNRKNKE